MIMWLSVYRFSATVMVFFFLEAGFTQTLYFFLTFLTAFYNSLSGFFINIVSYQVTIIGSPGVNININNRGIQLLIHIFLSSYHPAQANTLECFFLSTIWFIKTIRASGASHRGA